MMIAQRNRIAASYIGFSYVPNKGWYDLDGEFLGRNSLYVDFETHEVLFDQLVTKFNKEYPSVKFELTSEENSVTAIMFKNITNYLYEKIIN